VILIVKRVAIKKAKEYFFSMVVFLFEIIDAN
jgi:hypothetical protein